MPGIKSEEEKLLERGCEVLVEELGLSGFVKFIRLMGWAEGNWTEERRKVLKEVEEKLLRMTTEEVVEYFSKDRKIRPGQIVL